MLYNLYVRRLAEQSLGMMCLTQHLVPLCNYQLASSSLPKLSPLNQSKNHFSLFSGARQLSRTDILSTSASEDKRFACAAGQPEVQTSSSIASHPQECKSRLKKGSSFPGLRSHLIYGNELPFSLAISFTLKYDNSLKSHQERKYRIPH